MKKRMIVAAVVAASAGFASAGLDIGDYGSARLEGVNGYFGGGAFTWTSTNNPGTAVGTGNFGNFGSLVSFCIELNETVSPGSEYRWEVNDRAFLGGVGDSEGDPPAGDPLDIRTAALYEAYVTGLLSTYVPQQNTYTVREQNAALQMAIWYLEDEVTTFDAFDATNPLNGNRLAAASQETLADNIAVLAQVYWGAAAILANDGYGGRVRVLNMTNLNGTGNRQDMLILVPLPQAGALAGLGLAGLAIRRRR
jgi:hypothetical protein